MHHFWGLPDMAREWGSLKYPEVRSRYYETHGLNTGSDLVFEIPQRPDAVSTAEAPAPDRAKPLPLRADFPRSEVPESFASCAPESIRSPAVRRRATADPDALHLALASAERHDQNSLSQEIKSFQLIPDLSPITVWGGPSHDADSRLKFY